MTGVRQCARLLAAVIVLIAVGFGASVAQAHEGHVHHHPAAASAAPEVAMPVQVAARPVAGPTAFRANPVSLGVAALVTRAAPTAAKTALSAAAISGVDCGGCDGVCCKLGMACCHTALTPAASTGAPALARSSAVSVPQDALRPGLAPEALPKPPRSFA